MKNDYESLTHTKWRCQYHIVITPKYRRQIIYGRYKVEIGKILRRICERYEVEIIEANACSDHIHIAGSDTTKDVSIEIYGDIKRKSALMIFDRFANLRYKYGNRHFWCRGYFVDTVGRNKTAIQKYIQNQLAEDQICEQISMKEYIDPFTGEPEKEGKQKNKSNNDK
ncbi:MAG: IS200/IS605 family transposase [Lachnospiraceae bacterium]